MCVVREFSNLLRARHLSALYQIVLGTSGLDESTKAQTLPIFSSVIYNLLANSMYCIDDTVKAQS